MISRSSAQRTDPSRILDVVVELLESAGYDGWQVRDVAQVARVSLATIYKHFPTREELILAAVERWMAENAYGSLEDRAPGESLFEALMRMFRTIFEPWEKHPKMLDAFVRASSAGGGDRLFSQGLASAEPIAQALDGLEPAYVEDLSDILTNVTFGAMSRYVVGDINASDILPAIQRALRRLEDPTAKASELTNRVQARLPSERTRRR